MRLEPNGKTWTEPMRKRERVRARKKRIRQTQDAAAAAPPNRPPSRSRSPLPSASVRSFVPCIAEQGHKNCCFRAHQEGKEGERKARQQPSLKEVKDTQYRVPRDSDKVMIRHTGRLDRMLHRKWRETKQRSLL